MPTTTLCHWRPLDSAIVGYYINLRACKKSAHNIEISRSSTATKFCAPKIWSCDNPPQQWMLTTTLCHWRPLDSAIAGYYINLRAGKKLAHNIEIRKSSTATKFWALKIRSCNNPLQQWMPTTTLCHWQPLVSAIAGYYINLRACKKSAHNIEMSMSSTTTKLGLYGHATIHHSNGCRHPPLMLMTSRSDNHLTRYISIYDVLVIGKQE